MCQPSSLHLHHQHSAEAAGNALHIAAGVDPADSDFSPSDLVDPDTMDRSYRSPRGAALQPQPAAPCTPALPVLDDLQIYNRSMPFRLSKQDKIHRAFDTPRLAVGRDANGRSALSQSQCAPLSLGRRSTFPLVKLLDSRTRDLLSYGWGYCSASALEHDDCGTKISSPPPYRERGPSSSTAPSKGKGRQGTAARKAKSTGGFSQSSKSREKRPLSSDDPDGSEPEEVASPKQSRNHRELDKVYFGCPFAKRYPDEYENEAGPCTRPKSITWRYMHEHLQRKHSARKKCPICKKAPEWPRDMNWHDAWVQHYRIERRHTPEELARFPHIMTYDQEQVYMNPPLGKGTPEELWVEQYKRMFPEAQVIPSPYYDYYKRNTDRLPDERYERGASSQPEPLPQSPPLPSNAANMPPPPVGTPDSESVYRNNFNSSDPTTTPSTQATSLSPIYSYTNNTSWTGTPVPGPASVNLSFSPPSPTAGRALQMANTAPIEYQQADNLGEFGLHTQPIQPEAGMGPPYGINSQPGLEPWHPFNTVDPKNTYSGRH